MAFVVRSRSDDPSSPDQSESTAQKVVEIEDCERCWDDQKQGCPQSAHLVTTKLYLKSTGNNKVEKEHVMRRIRHRRRVNKARNFVQKLMGSAQSGGAERDKKWVDDAFSAP